jgi:hypothetical protein
VALQISVVTDSGSIPEKGFVVSKIHYF